ncbi:MAG: hypothetical protein JRI23_36110, partial [Deltaproteobacteria bacterium]|nr:hypothetical protein [Deltaproteobacteria bacterium]MBW2537774.1 hypothetical protein [Deltaproteobacteria bacterium]
MAAIVGTAGAAAGCGGSDEDGGDGGGLPSESACNVQTSGLYVEYEVQEAGATAVARAAFWIGDAPGGTSLNLAACATTIEVNGTPLASSGGSDDPNVEATIAPAGSYAFVFTRPSEAPYTTTVSTPAPPVVTAPTSGASLSRASAFDITWDPGTGFVDLLISGDCIWDYPNTQGDEISDSGSYTVPPNGIESTQGGASSSCSADLSLTRRQNASVGPDLRGRAEGLAVGRMTFTSVP